MTAAGSNRSELIVVFLIALLFISARIFGSGFFGDSWSLEQWRFLPIWYSLGWLLFFVTATSLVFLKSDQIASFFNSRLKIISGLLSVILIIVLMQFDSVVHAGGNLTIAQFSQTEHVIHRWYEFGSSVIIFQLYHLYDFLGMQANEASFYALKTFLFITVIVSMIGTLLLTAELSSRATHRFWYFLIIFFGPQSLAFFGLIGSELIVIPATIWFGLFAVRTFRQRSITALVSVWMIFIVSAILHYSAAILFPAAVYVTLRHFLRPTKFSKLSLSISLLATFMLVFFYYLYASYDYELSFKLLHLKGTNPFLFYGLFSQRHLGDMMQMLFLFFPQILLLIFLGLKAKREGNNAFAFAFSGVIFLSGLIFVFIANPSNSVLMELPAFAVYFMAGSIWACTALKTSDEKQTNPTRLLALVAVLSIAFLFSYLPVYSKITLSDKFSSSYFDKFPAYYTKTGLAFRDAYFLKKDLDNANKWDIGMRIKSADYLAFSGANNLVEKGEFTPALEELFRLKTKYPTWTEPRILISAILQRLGQYKEAKAEIDTLLLLQPYNKNHYHTLFNYFYSQRNYLQALETADKSLKIFPEDKKLLVDKMTALFYTRDDTVADSLAREIIRIDSLLPYPYMFRGLIMEQRKNFAGAKRNYQKFIKLLPDSPDTPAIRKKLNDLILKENETE